MDVTEEAWFQNERDGSLDQQSLQTIQKQLFGNPSYLMNRMMSSPSRTVSKCDESHINHENEISTPGVDNREKKEEKTPLPFPLDFDQLEATPNEKRQEDEDVDNFLYSPGEMSTPPRRQRHTANFLVDAGLLQEAGKHEEVDNYICCS